jgi:class 3 adenylate cyclase
MRIKLRVQVSIILSIFICIIIAVISLIILEHEKKILTKELVKKGYTLAKNLAYKSKEALSTKDDIALITATTDILKEEKDILYIYIVDENGIIRASGNIKEDGGKKYIHPSGKKEMIENIPITNSVYNGKKSFDIEIKLQEKDKKLGEVHLGISWQSILDVITNARNNVIRITVCILIISIFVATFLVGYIVRPIKLLVSCAKNIANGLYDVNIPVKSKNELGELTKAFNEMANSLKEKEKIKSAFSKYMSEELLKEVIKEKGELKLGGEKRKVTILFSDVRDFTAIAEKLPAEEVVSTLNEYFTEMTKIIFKYKGFVNFMGDAIMAIYGAPISYPDDAIRSVFTAVEMMEMLSKLNEKWAISGRQTLSVGIGINTGEVIAGNIGSMQHLEYTVIGDDVNIAFRLQALNKQFNTKILITENTYNEVKDYIEARKLQPVLIKGKTEPVQIYELIKIKQS